MCIPSSDQFLGQTGQLHHPATKQERSLHSSFQLEIAGHHPALLRHWCTDPKEVLAVTEGTCSVGLCHTDTFLASSP